MFALVCILGVLADAYPNAILIYDDLKKQLHPGERGTARGPAFDCGLAKVYDLRAASLLVTSFLPIEMKLCFTASESTFGIAASWQFEAHENFQKTAALHAQAGMLRQSAAAASMCCGCFQKPGLQALTSAYQGPLASSAKARGSLPQSMPRARNCQACTFSQDQHRAKDFLPLGCCNGS